jgi:hypothetical protein
VNGDQQALEEELVSRGAGLGTGLGCMFAAGGCAVADPYVGDPAKDAHTD